jgi:hypothetical protein
MIYQKWKTSIAHLHERPTLIDKLENQLKNNKRRHRTDPKLLSEAM